MMRVVKRILKVIVIAPLALILLLFIAALPYHVFPSDREMEQRLLENKKDFERLVALAQEGKRTRVTDEPDYQMHTDKEAIMLQEKLGVYRAFAYDLWLDNPYSTDYAYRASEARRNSESAIYYSVQIQPVNGRYSSLGVWKVIDKSYWYIPQIAEIENGWLMAQPNYQGEKKPRFHVEKSLDWFWVRIFSRTEKDKPPCVVKLIDDPHWYIMFCISK